MLTRLLSSWNTAWEKDNFVYSSKFLRSRHLYDFLNPIHCMLMGTGMMSWAESYCSLLTLICLDKYQMTTRTCISATELNTSELVNPGKRQKTTTRSPGNCILHPISLFCWNFWSSHWHWPALPPRPLVLSLPAGARLSVGVSLLYSESSFSARLDWVTIGVGVSLLNSES